MGKILVVLSFFLVFSCTKKSSDNPNVLNLVILNKIKGMDPAGVQDLYSSDEIMWVYEGLLQYHPFIRPYVLEPLLAEALSIVSKNNLVYIFKIRKGVKFHDSVAFPGGKGREVKAKDFEYSFKRLADPRVQSIGWWLFEKCVKGLDVWRKKYQDTKDVVNYDDEVAGLKALDDYILQIELVQSYP